MFKKQECSQIKAPELSRIYWNKAWTFYWASLRIHISNLAKKDHLFYFGSRFEGVQWKPQQCNMVSSLISLDMERAGQILGTGTSTLAGRSSSLDTCFRFLENHSSSHTWARFRFKARPVTTVSVYNKTSLSLLLNMGENVLEIGPHFYPEAPCSFCLCWYHVQALSLILVEICFLMSVLQKTSKFQGYPALKGAQRRAGSPTRGFL